MPRTVARFKQCEIRAAVKGAIAGGASVSEIILNETGVVIKLGTPHVDDTDGTHELEQMIAQAKDKVRK